MRYVKNKLVLRLKSRPSDEQLDEIRSGYADILTSGGFELLGALPEERDETELSDHARLVFHFNRRSLGRLRELIDTLNGAPHNKG
jgi:hypothetical protein